MKQRLLLSLAFVLGLASPSFASFGFYSPVTVQTGQVPSTQTNFPVLVSYTDTRLKTVGNGGHVQSASGFDIRPYSDSGLSSAMTFELESYDASTGQVIMWVKVSSLADGSVIYLAYGDSGISTDGSSTATWDSNYKVVWHLPNGSSLTANDSTSNANSGTVSAATATAGQIDGGADFSPSSAKIDKTSASNLPVSAANSFTVQGWHKSSAFDSLGVMFGFGNPDSAGIGDERFLIQFNNHYYFWGAGVDYDTGVAWDSDNVWHQWAFTFAVGVGIIFYRDGILASGPASYGGLNTASAEIRAGFATTWSTNIHSKQDELRISATNRSADWIATEYHNQSAPSTFAVLGTEVAAGGGSCTPSLTLLGVGRC